MIDKNLHTKCFMALKGRDILKIGYLNKNIGVMALKNNFFVFLLGILLLPLLTGCKIYGFY